MVTMLEFEEYKIKLNNLRPTLLELGDALKLDEARREAASLEEESAQPGFWNDVLETEIRSMSDKKLMEVYLNL